MRSCTSYAAAYTAFLLLTTVNTVFGEDAYTVVEHLVLANGIAPRYARYLYLLPPVIDAQHSFEIAVHGTVVPGKIDPSGDYPIVGFGDSLRLQIEPNAVRVTLRTLRLPQTTDEADRPLQTLQCRLAKLADDFDELRARLLTLQAEGTLRPHSAGQVLSRLAEVIPDAVWESAATAITKSTRRREKKYHGPETNEAFRTWVDNLHADFVPLLDQLEDMEADTLDDLLNPAPLPPPEKTGQLGASHYVLAPGDGERLRLKIAQILPARLLDSLGNAYGFATLPPNDRRVLIDLLPGMQLATVPAPYRQRDVGAGPRVGSTWGTVSRRAQDGLLGFDSFLDHIDALGAAPDDPPSTLEPDPVPLPGPEPPIPMAFRWFNSVADLHLRGLGRKYGRIVHTHQFFSAKPSPEETVRDMPVLLLANSRVRLKAATDWLLATDKPGAPLKGEKPSDNDWVPPKGEKPSAALSVLCFVSRGRDLEEPRIVVSLNGEPISVPVGETLAGLVSRERAWTPQEMAARVRLSRSCGKRHLPVRIRDLAPGAFDIPLVQGDRIQL